MADNTITVPCPECNGPSTDTVAGDAHYHCQGCANSFELAVSEHITTERWPERVYDGRFAPSERIIEQDVKQTWDESCLIPDDPRDWGQTDDPADVEPADLIGHRFVGDELRFDDTTDIVLLRRGHSLVTAIYVPRSRLNLRYSVVQRLVSDGNPNDAISDACQRYRLTTDQLATVIERAEKRHELAGTGRVDGFASDAVSSSRNPDCNESADSSATSETTADSGITVGSAEDIMQS